MLVRPFLTSNNPAHSRHAVRTCSGEVSPHLVFGKLGAACPVLAMTIKDPKEHLLWVARKAPIRTDRVLHELRFQCSVWHQRINSRSQYNHIPHLRSCQT